MRPWIVAFAMALIPSVAGAQDPFSYHEPGDLIPDSGTGLVEYKVFAPGMRFPMSDGPAYANSQVYMHGGYLGPGGGQCDVENYSFPWRDNYCETRSWNMPLCPSGVGHQGQDIRPGTCEDSVHGLVAAATGKITNIGSYSVYLTADDGTRFDYLHGSDVAVNYGQGVDIGDAIAKVSNEFGGTSTTIHLHYNIKQDVAGVGFVFVSPYMSLVESYKEMMGLTNNPPNGTLDETGCVAIRGWAQDPDLPEDPVAVRLHFDGPLDDPQAIIVEVTADLYREDLCDALGSCEHAFEVEVPRALMDGIGHDVFVYALDDEGGDNVELSASPGTVDCAHPPIPDGVRRHVTSPESLASWQFSPLWDLAAIDDVELDAIEVGPDLAEGPLLVRSEADVTTVWLIDQGLRRLVDGAEVMDAWRFDPATVLTWPAESVTGIAEGTPLRPAPFLVQAAGPEIYLIDDQQCVDGEDDCDPGGDGDSDTDTGTGDTSGPLPPGYGDEGDGGCGCGAGGAPAPSWWMLVGLGLVIRRRR